MAYKQRGWSAFTKKTDPPKKYPPHYTEEDIKFLKEQNEDIVREDDKHITIKIPGMGAGGYEEIITPTIPKQSITPPPPPPTFKPKKKK